MIIAGVDITVIAVTVPRPDTVEIITDPNGNLVDN